MRLENQNIVIVSNEPWGDIWYSKHNYAHELSKKNNVIFLDPPKPFKPGNILNFRIEEKKISSNLTVIQYPNVFPVSLFGFWKPNDSFVLKKLHKYFEKKNFRNLIFWTFDPIRLYKPELLHPSAIVLHAVDAYLFSYKSEAFIAKSADLVICVSDDIARNYKKYNSNVITVPHAIPDDEFLPINAKRNTPLKGLFIGKIDLRIDFGFNIEVFRSFPEIQFTIVGTVEDEFKKRVAEEKLSNVIYHPPVRSHELKKYISESDFCFIFKKIYDGNNISSHKLLQYLAQGKPIFGTDFSDLSKDLKDTLYLSNDINEIKRSLKTFSEKEEPAVKFSIRINYAKRFTFSQAIDKIKLALKFSGKSNPYLYYNHMSAKTRAFNIIRKRFANVAIDSIFSGLMSKVRFLHPVISKLIAPEYLYKDPSYREHSTHGVKMQLNISNLVDHCIYFSTEQKAIDRFISHLKKSDTVIDIGANIGYTTLLFSKACVNGKVFSVEPSKELFRAVEDHLKLNHITNAKVLNIGLGEKEKTVRLYKVSETNSGMNRVLEEQDIPFNSESIHIKTLDEVVREEKIAKVNAIKIDVEGYEFNILKGAHKTLEKDHPILLIEIDDMNLKEQNATPTELFKFLIALNYSIFEAVTMQKIDLTMNYTGKHFDVICFNKTN